MKRSSMLFPTLAVVLLAGAAPAAAEVRIGGAGTTLAVMAMLGAAFEKTAPGSTVRVDMNSKASVGGVRALLKGEFDIALATREVTDKDIEGMSKLVSFELARVPSVFAVNAATPTKGVTSTELLQIYQLRKTTWDDGSRIVIIPRTMAVSDTLFLMEISEEWKSAVKALEANNTIDKYDTAQDAANLVEKRRGAITTSTLGLIRAEKRKLMKPLLVDGADPTSRDYPYYKPIIALTLPNAPPEVGRFLRFLCTRTAQRILEDNGYTVTLDKSRCSKG
jgi:ABC-type phosphate transport system substrate-binding protein